MTLEDPGPHDSYKPKASEAPKIGPVFITASDIRQRLAESFTDPSNGHCSWKTLLSSGLSTSDSMTAGIAICPPKTGYLAHHRHEQAEIYFIMEGEGEMVVDETERKVAKGDVVFVPGNAEHGIRNLKHDQDVVWFYCFAADRFEDVKYRFSGGQESRVDRVSSKL